MSWGVDPRPMYTVLKGMAWAINWYIYFGLTPQGGGAMGSTKVQKNVKTPTTYLAVQTDYFFG